ncbi:peptide deformylase [Streptomyces sp. NPDC057781]|uniref:peptide deformylase n=1 Tax=unclassified Streptomyces TaxID=2593676 RepID=UPI003688B0CA
MSPAELLTEPARPFVWPAEQEAADTVVENLFVAIERLVRAHDFTSKGLGVAAPQIGICRSAAVVQPPDADPIELLNPRITSASGGRASEANCLLLAIFHWLCP